MTVLASVSIGLATIGTLIGVAVIVAALALYLITIAAILRQVSFNVGTVLIGVRAIANQTEPLAPVIRDIIGDVQAIQGDLEGLLGKRPAGRARARR